MIQGPGLANASSTRPQLHGMPARTLSLRERIRCSAVFALTCGEPGCIVQEFQGKDESSHAKEHRALLRWDRERVCKKPDQCHQAVLDFGAGFTVAGDLLSSRHRYNGALWLAEPSDAQVHAAAGHGSGLRP